MRKKFITIVIAILLLTSGIFASAYFYIKFVGQTHGVTANLGQASIIEIDSYESLVYYGYIHETSDYNSNVNYSDVSTRKTLLLTSDITLKGDVLVNRDCHINLNSKKIDLNGHDINIKNHYEGVFALYNGSIIDTVESIDEQEVVYGKVLIDCPYAVYDFTGLVYDESIIEIVDVADEQVCLAAFDYIYANISNAGINDFYDSKNNDINLSYCDFCGSEEKYCVYTYTDLDLIDNYYTYDLKIEYASSNTNILTNAGRIISNASTNSVTFTISISKGEEKVIRNITVHIVGQRDFEKAAVSALTKYLSKYYSEDKYVFGNSFVLPIENDYFNVDYLYTLSNGITSARTNDYFDLDSIDGMVLVGINSDIEYFNITALNKNDSQIKYTSNDLSVLGESSSNIDDNHSYALAILSKIFGNQVTVQNGQATTSNFSDLDLLTDPEVGGYARLTNISYELVNNYEGTYEIVEHGNNPSEYDLLRVPKDAATKPYLGQTVFLVSHFTFKDGSIVSIQLPIVYQPKAIEASKGFDAFSPYYVYFDNNFIRASNNNFTIDSFSIPLEYGNDYPIYQFRIYEAHEDATFTRVELGELFNIELSGNNTYELFEQGATTNIIIDKRYISFETKTYYFVYIPIYKDGSGDLVYWGPGNSSYEDMEDVVIDDLIEYEFSSILTIPGIVRYEDQGGESVQTEEFADKDLYALAYELLYQEKYTDQYILSSALSRRINLVDFSSDNGVNKLSLTTTDTAGVVNSLKGINLLTGIYELTFEGTSLLTGSDLNMTEIEYISKITNLEILSLKNTSIYDSKQANTGFADGESNNFLMTLSSLTNLRRLDLSNNKIFSFSDLDLFTSLEYVDVGGNTFTSTLLNTGFDTIDDYVNDMLTEITNSINGSNGAMNVAVYSSLETKGVKVVGAGNGGEVRIEVEAILNALISLEYQDKLSKELPMNLIYDHFSTSASSYGLYTTYQDVKSNVTITFVFQSISFESNDTFDSVTGEYTGTYFTFKINYQVYWDSLFNDDDAPITYTQNYRITRY